MKRKIDLSLTMKAMMPEIFTGWDPMTPTNQLALGYGIFLPLPGYDPLGRKIMIYRMGCFPTDKITAEELEKASGMVSEIMGLEGEYKIVKLLLPVILSKSNYYLLYRTESFHHWICCYSGFRRVYFKLVLYSY